MTPEQLGPSCYLAGARATSYDEMIKLKERGRVKHIGISLTDHRHDQGISIIRNGLVDSVQTVVNIFAPLAFDSLIPRYRIINGMYSLAR